LGVPNIPTTSEIINSDCQAGIFLFRQGV
jgi:hypothetical protein